MKELFNIDLKKLSNKKIVDWAYCETLEAKSYEHFERWINNARHGSLSYLADHRKELRKDLCKIWPKAQSYLTFFFSYKETYDSANSFNQSEDSNGLKIASYALDNEGIDYHIVVKDVLTAIGKELEKSFSSLEFKPVLDIEPILERDLAYRSGLGWFGKNSMLISRKHGSTFFIATLLLSKKLNIDTKNTLETDHCGSCMACVDFCPTDAIDPKTRTLIASQCISTWTIEVFKDIVPPPKGMEESKGYVFGCDICQQVCPWNKDGNAILDLKEHKIVKDFLIPKREKIVSWLNTKSNKWFQREYKTSPMGRTGRVGVLKNIKKYIEKEDE